MQVQLLLISLLTAFILTQLLEWLVFAILTQTAWSKAFWFMLNINAITWPVLQVVYSFSLVNIYIAELGVVIAEAILIRLWWRWPWIKCFMVALVINSISYFVGTYIYTWLFP